MGAVSGPRAGDPQSAGGLLQEAYACLGVSSFWRWRRQAEDGAAAARAHLGMARSREAAAQATRVLLASGRAMRRDSPSCRAWPRPSCWGGRISDAAPVGAERVAVRYSKWGYIDHWHFELEPLGQDQFGWWFFGPKGIIQHRAPSPRSRSSHDFVLLMPAAGCWTACFNA